MTGCGLFTFYAGRLCGGEVGVLFRWFGRGDVERFRVCVAVSREVTS